MILVGFSVLRFRQILIYFLSSMHQSHMGFIAVSESIHFGLSKTIFTFPKFFRKSWDSEAKCGKIKFGPFFGHIRTQTLAKITFK